MLLLTLALIVALVLSAFFTAAEVSVFSVGPHRINSLIEEGRRGSAALAALRTRPGRAVVFLRLGDAVADLTAGAIAAYIAYQYWNLLGVIIAMLSSRS